MTETVATIFALIISFGFIFFVFAYIIAIYAFVFAIIIFTFVGLGFWVFMLVDCLQRSDEEFPEKNNWTIILILTFAVGMAWLGALIYYVKIKKPASKVLNDASAEALPRPQSTKGKQSPNQRKAR
jgi:hypothetical protein